LQSFAAVEFAHIGGIALDKRQSGRTLRGPRVRQGEIMSNKPTRTAVAGRFQSKTGEDLIQFVDKDGNVVVWIDCNGVLYVNSSAVIHGAAGATGVSAGPGQPGNPS
jgi:hypothetical protein